ncbi:MAG: hypothetical protein ACOC24_07640 [Desulfovibrionales bacterium]
MRFSSSSQDSSPVVRIIKFLTMAGLFAAVVILFWKHYERSLDRIVARSDQPPADMSSRAAERKKTVEDAIARIKGQYGVEVNVNVSTGELLIPDTGGNTVFVGILPNRQTAVVILPPLVERSVGRQFAAYLKYDHFKEYWDMPNGWEKGLEDGLILLWNTLRQNGEHGAGTTG